MTLKLGTSFTGVTADHGFSRTKIVASDLDAVAADQAYVYEKLTNKTAAGTGGAPATNVGHAHEEFGNLIYWPLMHQVFGSSGSLNISNDLLTTDSLPLTITSDTSTTPVDGFILFGIPIYVPPGFEDLPLTVTLECTGDPPRVSLMPRDSGLAEIGDFILFSQSFRDTSPDAPYLWRVTTPVGIINAAGLWVLDIRTDIIAEVEQRKFHSISVGWYIDPLAIGLPRSPPPAASVGTAITVPSWQPVDSLLTGADFPLGPVARLVVDNNARVYEEATGLPAPGNASATASGHNHDGSNSLGISYNVASFCLGAETNSLAITGNNAWAPFSTSNVFDTVQHVVLRMPVSVNTTKTTTSKLKGAVLVTRSTDGGKSGYARVEIVTDANGGSTLAFSASVDGLELLDSPTGDTTLEFTSGDYDYITLRMKSSQVAPNSDSRVLGWCLYFEQA